MFLIITRDTMFFTAMKNILSKGNVVHIQNEEEIDVMLHQNAFVIIDTLMNNVFHSNFLTQIERLKPVHVIIFSPFNIKRCLGKVPVTFVPRTIAIIDFVALINGSYCSVPEADVSLAQAASGSELHCESNDNGRYSGETENIAKNVLLP